MVSDTLACSIVDRQQFCLCPGLVRELPLRCLRVPETAPLPAPSDYLGQTRRPRCWRSAPSSTAASLAATGMLCQQDNGHRQPLLKTKRHALFKGDASMPLSSQSRDYNVAIKGESHRFDVVYRYYHGTDTLSIYFAKATPGVIESSVDIATNVLADYTSDDKIVSIDMYAASKRVACHFWDCADQVDGKPPLSLVWDYDASEDKLIVHLHAGAEHLRLVQSTDDDIMLGLSASDIWTSVFITHAASRVCQQA